MAEAAAGAVVDDEEDSDGDFGDEGVGLCWLVDDEEGGVVLEEFHRDRTKGEYVMERVDGRLADSTGGQLVKAAALTDSSKRELAVERPRLPHLIDCTCTLRKVKAACLLLLAAQRGPRGMKLILEAHSGGDEPEEKAEMRRRL